MEITSITHSLSRPPPPSIPFSSSRSNFISSSNTISLLNKAKSQNKSVLLVGQPRRRRTMAEPAKKGLTCNALFGLGVPELVVIAGVAALLFGPKNLPQAAKEFESELKKDPESLTKQSEENPTAVSEGKKPDVDVSSSSKESV